MKKNPEQTEMTKNNIKEAYCKMLCEGQNVKVDRVCKIAGYNRCTFYRYYSDINELQEEVEKDIAKRIYSVVCGMGENLDLEHFVERITDLYEKEGELISVLLERYPTFISVMKEKMTPLVRRHFSIDVAYNENLAISYISTAITHTILAWYRNGKKESVYDVSKFIINALQKGVLS